MTPTTTPILIGMTIDGYWTWSCEACGGTSKYAYLEIAEARRLGGKHAQVCRNRPC